MASHHEIMDFIENIRAEMPERLHHFYEEAVDRALEEQQRRGREFAHQIIKRNPMIRKEWNRQKEEEGILAIVVLIIGFLGGAALMYLFDPDRGEQRRASLLGQVNHAADQVSESLKDTTTQVQHQASKAVSSVSGTGKETAGQVNAAVSDATLSARVRVEIAKDVRAPGAIEVTVAQGVVTLKGKVQASEVKELVEKIQVTPGVKSVENRLEIHDATPSVGSAPGNNGTPR